MALSDLEGVRFEVLCEFLKFIFNFAQFFIKCSDTFGLYENLG